jgi:hypothetical protein
MFSVIAFGKVTTAGQTEKSINEKIIETKQILIKLSFSVKRRHQKRTSGHSFE